MGGTWKAWLSSSTVDAASRLTQTPSSYLRIDGATIASSWSDLIDGVLTNPISINEFGTAVTTYGVWTNTTISGTRFSTGADQLCLDWTTGTEWNALIGLANDTWNYWTNKYGQACTNLFRLYCFEQ